MDGYSSYPVLMELLDLLAFGRSVRKWQKRTEESLHWGVRMARGGVGGGPCDPWRENQEPTSHLPQEVETLIPPGPDR